MMCNVISYRIGINPRLCLLPGTLGRRSILLYVQYIFIVSSVRTYVQYVVGTVVMCCCIPDKC
jgi:hypothetical protein